MLEISLNPGRVPENAGDLASMVASILLDIINIIIN